MEKPLYLSCLSKISNWCLQFNIFYLNLHSYSLCYKAWHFQSNIHIAAQSSTASLTYSKTRHPLWWMTATISTTTHKLELIDKMTNFKRQSIEYLTKITKSKNLYSTPIIEI